MGVSLYTSRVVLNTLGIQDYGIYVVVGGVVSLFSFFNGAMASATQRFLSFEIGKGDQIKLKQTFNATLNIHIVIGVLIWLMAETVGLWFVNYRLNVPIEKMNVINWIYQFSILVFLVDVVQVPYNALIVARERMNVYAMFSIAEVILKLLILYLLVISPFDKLKSYATLIFIITLLIAFLYKYYCKKNFNESKYEFYYQKELYRTLISYSGWNLFGNIAAVARGQGINVILNIFFGTILNAAYGITMQVQGSVSVFVTNFQMAVNPQIIKNYAMENTKQTKILIFQSAKLSYFLMFLIVGPVFFNVDFILKKWLINPPEYTSIFIILCLINLLIDCISGPLMTGIQATGNIKRYQMVVGTLVFLNLPLAYLILKINRNPELIYYTSILISLFSLMFRLYFLKKSLNISILEFMQHVLLRVIVVTTVSLFVFLLLNKFIYFSNDWISFFLKSLLIIFIIMINISVLGINKKERLYLSEIFTQKLLKR